MSGSSLTVKLGYVNAPLKNGVGRFIPQCQRITIKFCKAWGGSQGVRDFIQHDLVDFARSNPWLVTYVKPRRHKSPVVVAEYLNGHREWMSMQNMERAEINKWIEHLKNAGGQGEMMYKRFTRTDIPSVQGPWNPFTNKHPEKFTAQYPNEEFAQVPNRQKSATEILLKYQQEQQGTSSAQPGTSS